MENLVIDTRITSVGDLLEKLDRVPTKIKLDRVPTKIKLDRVPTKIKLDKVPTKI